MQNIKVRLLILITEMQIGWCAVEASNTHTMLRSPQDFRVQYYHFSMTDLAELPISTHDMHGSVSIAIMKVKIIRPAIRRASIGSRLDL